MKRKQVFIVFYSTRNLLGKRFVGMSTGVASQEMEKENDARLVFDGVSIVLEPFGKMLENPRVQMKARLCGGVKILPIVRVTLAVDF